MLTPINDWDPKKLAEIFNEEPPRPRFDWKFWLGGVLITIAVVAVRVLYGQ